MKERSPHQLERGFWALPVTDDEWLRLSQVPGLEFLNGRVIGRVDAIAVACKSLGLPSPIPIKEIVLHPAWVTDSRLRNYQQNGILQLASIIRNFGGAILADEMGLGKTRQAIATADLMKVKPVVIVARASVRETWRAELKTWGVSEDDIAILGPISDKSYEPEWDRLKKAKWIVVSYAMLEPMMQQRFSWESPGFLIIDEVHEVKSRSGRAKRADAVSTLARLCPYKLGISGTPFDNSPVDLFRIIDTLWGNSRFGNYSEFTRRYCNGRKEGHGWKADGSTNGEELNLRLSYYMVRREKREVAKELPAKTRQVLWVDADAGALEAYRRLELGTGTVNDALMAALECKIPAAIEAAKEAGKFLLLTWMRDHAEQMAKTLGVPFIHGGLSTQKRAEIVRDCASRGMGVVATADSVGVGVDGLQHVASIGIMHSFDWRPLLMAQREDRLHRLGQKGNVHWIYLAAKSSLDEPVVKRLVKKLDAFREVIGKAEDARGLRDALNTHPEDVDEAAFMRSLLNRNREED